jgi:NHL repeat
MRGIRQASIIVGAIALMGMLASPAIAKPSYTYEFSIGSSGSGNGQFKNPQAVAVDGEGNVWVADWGNKRLQKFNSKGEFLLETKAGGEPTAPLYPIEIQVDSKGNIWVLDEYTDRAIEYSCCGGKIDSRGSGLSQPETFAIDSGGYFWFASINDERVVQTDLSKGLVSEFPIEVGGPGGGKFYKPTGMGFDLEGNLWISDGPGWAGSSVQKFNTAGTFLGRAGQGYLSTALSSPWFDSEGNLWIGDCYSETGAVKAFNAKSPSAPVNQFGEFGFGEGQIHCAQDIAADSKGNLWVLDSSSNTLDKWTVAPTAITEDATDITTSEATLNGSVNPHGIETTYLFEYGSSGGYGKAAPPKSAGSGTESAKVNLKITGLSPNTLYYYRISATNSHGTTVGKDKWFIAGPAEWGISPTEEPVGASAAALSGVSCTSSETCTTVGYYTSSGKNHGLAKVQSAGKWSLTSVSEPAGTTGSNLYNVSCSASDACTAVGSYATSGSSGLNLVERWNGTSWAVQSAPKPAEATTSGLIGVSCTTANDCTAVGESRVKKEGGEETASTLVERWNGTTWSIVSSPNVAGYTLSQLYDVACVSASDCWAVGRVAGGKPEAPLAEHWNGSAWSVNSPTGLSGRRLTNVSCGSASSCVATSTKNGSESDLLLARWNGSSWSTETAPAPADVMKEEGSSWAYVKDASCTSASACVATGEYVNDKGKRVPMAMGWNGSKWSLQTAGTPAGAETSSTIPLAGVSCTSATACTAVGRYSASGVGKTLIESRK